MNTTVMLLVQQVLIMFLLAGVGYIFFRSGKITKESSKSIANILIYLSLPCVIINSFLLDFSYERLIGLLLSSFAAAVLMALSIAVSRIFFAGDAILNFASSFSNPGFFGVPLIAASLTEGAVFYVTPFIVFTNLLQWTYGVSLLTAEGEQSDKKPPRFSFMKRLMSAPFMIACLIGLFFFFSGFQMPEILHKSIQHIANLNTPLAMFTIGIYLAQTDAFKMLCNKKMYLLSAVRLLVIPVLSILLLAFIPEEFADMKMALLTVAACPVGSNVAVYAQLYKRDYAYAVETVVMSTALSVITIPLVIRIASLF